MGLILYAHPFSSYCQKVLVALDELGAAYEFRMVDPAHPEHMAELEAVWPFRLFPVLVDDGWPVREASIIVEHLDLHHGGPGRLIPADPAAALEVRFMDRVFDNHVSTPQGRVVFDALRPEADRDPVGVTDARRKLEFAYRWLDGVMADREWAAGGDFSLADCGAGPFLFYADWTHPIPENLENLHRYRRRLLKRPSFARALDGARSYRAFFPLEGTPRDD